MLRLNQVQCLAVGSQVSDAGAIFPILLGELMSGNYGRMAIGLGSARRGHFSRVWVLLPLLAAEVVLAPLALRAQTVDEVIAKNIQAHGGLEKIKAVNTLRNSAKLSFGAFRATATQENKRPDKVREEFAIQGLAQVQAYDGKVAWQVSPFEGRKDPQLMSAEDAKSLIVDSDIDGPLVDYKAKGHKAELMGHDSVEGTDCYKLKLSMKNGDVRYYYLDTDSFLELKMEVQTTVRGTLQENEIYYGDYEQVDGIYYPFAVEQAQKGSEQRQKLSVEKIEINVPIADAKFVMPVMKTDAKAAPAGK
jgi:hypothetical protein